MSQKCFEGQYCQIYGGKFLDHTFLSIENVSCKWLLMLWQNNKNGNKRPRQGQLEK